MPSSAAPDFEASSRWLAQALTHLREGYSDLPSLPAAPETDPAVARVLMELAERLRDNYPYFHPQYAGQMLRPPHEIARLAYSLAMWVNPNNHALDGGRATSALEKEAVAAIAGMFGWERHLGHLCAGGTHANLEALWIARQLRPGQKVVASQQAHFTHQRLSVVLGMECELVPADAQARMDLAALKTTLAKGGVGLVVATVGTTATGSVDPLPELLALRQQYGFRLHADAAYGGYFGLAENLDAPTRQAFDRLGEVDSLVIDPHKHGLQPYGCGCVLFRDPEVGRFYKHDSPYTYFSSPDLHLGEISLECSRPGASAAALWATQRLLPMTRGGAFAQDLARCREAALAWHARLRADARFVTAFPPALDIVVWAPRAASVSEASRLSRAIFEAAARRGLHLALATLPTRFFDVTGMKVDADSMVSLRSVLMKPEHCDWLDILWQHLDQAARAAGLPPS